MKIGKEDARVILAANAVARGQNFYTLFPAQVCGLLEEADRLRYHQPKNANGSRGRYFHEYLQRQAR